MRKKLTFIFLFISILVFALPALAHNPRIVKNNELIQINNPDISQAFYGELKGNPQTFEFNIDKAKELYFGILVPDLPDIKKDKSAYITSGDIIFANLDAADSDWVSFHEEFANDDYFQGPEFKSEAIPGKYLITVQSPDNTGKYVLVIGEKESFPLSEIINTILVLPTIKHDFFGKASISAFTNKIGLFIFGPIIGVLILIIVAIYLFRIFKKKKIVKNKKTIKEKEFDEVADEIIDETKEENDDFGI